MHLNLIVDEVITNHYGIHPVCRVPKAYGKGRKAHGKVFTMRNTQQTAHGIQAPAKYPFAVGRAVCPAGPRQKKVNSTVT